jgi:hypothetical protein
MHSNIFRELAIEQGVSIVVISEAIRVAVRGSAIFNTVVPQLML